MPLKELFSPEQNKQIKLRPISPVWYMEKWSSQVRRRFNNACESPTRPPRSVRQRDYPSPETIGLRGEILPTGLPTVIDEKQTCKHRTEGMWLLHCLILCAKPKSVISKATTRNYQWVREDKCNRPLQLKTNNFISAIGNSKLKPKVPLD